MKNYLFDFDGTLVDSLIFWGCFWEELSKKYLNGKSYFINENKLILRLGRTYEKIDFNELSEFENLSVLL